MNVLKTGWGGKGEHGVLEVDMTLTGYKFFVN